MCGQENCYTMHNEFYYKVVLELNYEEYIDNSHKIKVVIKEKGKISELSRSSIFIENEFYVFSKKFHFFTRCKLN